MDELIKYAPGLVVLFLALFGVKCVYEGLRSFQRTRTRLQSRLHAKGTIVSVEQKEESSGRPGVMATGPTTFYFPRIDFTSTTGQPLNFTAAVGGVNPKEYLPGQIVDVLFDPTGADIPVLNTWSNLWMEGIAFTLGGLFLLIVLILVVPFFAQEILAPLRH